MGGVFGARSIAAYAEAMRVPNVLPPILLDVSQGWETWGGTQPATLDLLVSINMMHIAELRCTEVSRGRDGAPPAPSPRPCVPRPPSGVVPGPRRGLPGRRGWGCPPSPLPHLALSPGAVQGCRGAAEARSRALHLRGGCCSAEHPSCCGSALRGVGCPWGCCGGGVQRGGQVREWLGFGGARPFGGRGVALAARLQDGRDPVLPLPIPGRVWGGPWWVMGPIVGDGADGG